MNNYLYLRIEGRNINRFLLKCNKNNINILFIRHISYRSIIILINDKDYKKILKIRGLNKIKIINKKGPNKYKELINKYKVFIITFIIGIFILIILSNIIFKIEVISNNKDLSDLIIKELDNYDIKKYSFKKSYNKINIIKKNIKNKYKDKIEWIEITNDGTKVIVNIVERKIDNTNTDSNIYSIVAKRNGIIKKIKVDKGISMYEENTYVNKGDIIISSDIYLNEELKNRVSSEGKVYAETWYKVHVEYPLNYKETKYTNNKRKIPYIKIGNDYLELFNYKNYSRNSIISLKDNIFEIGLEEIKEELIINKKLSLEAAKKEAIDYAKKKIEDRLKDDERIISQKTLNFSNNGSKIIIDIFFSVYEEIGEKRIIEMGEAYDTKDIRDGAN